MDQTPDIFLYRCDGIAFWEGLEPPLAAGRAKTLTIFSWRHRSVLACVGKALAGIEGTYGTLLRWRTEGYPGPDGRVQRYIREKDRARPVKGFELLVGRETERRIYCSIFRLVAPFDEINPDLWSDPRGTAIILAQSPHPEAPALWDTLAPYDEFLTPAAAEAVVRQHAGTLFCRCHDDGCMPLAWQFIGPEAAINDIAARPALSGLPRVTTQDEITAALGSRSAASVGPV